MNKVDENIRYIAIANLLDRKIIVDYMPPSKKEKKASVNILIIIYQNKIKKI